MRQQTDSASLIYVTRSIVPSPYANTVQSANMACAFAKLRGNCVAAFRVPRKERMNLAKAFADLGLNPPANLVTFPSHPRFDWTEYYLPGFVRFLCRQPRGASVYTRSGRLAWIATALGFNTTIEIHDPLKNTSAAWLRRMRERGTVGKIVATTSRMKQDLVDDIGLPPDRVLVAGGGANAAFADLPARGLGSGYAFNVGYAGSAFKGKGLEVLLACASRLPTIGFHVIGPAREECQKHGVMGGNVICHGRKTNVETVSLLKAMDCLLLANQRSVIIRDGSDIGSYTSPLKMFEYMATGRAIVASDLPVLKMALKDGENALLCSPNSPEEFCRKILYLKANPQVGAYLGERNARDFQRAYTWEIRARRILDFLEL